MWAGHLEAASPAAVGTQEQHQNYEQKQQHERVHQRPTRDAENHQHDEQKQKQIHAHPLSLKSLTQRLIYPAYLRLQSFVQASRTLGLV